MNNVLVGIGVLIVAVLSALFAIPRFIDWNSYRGVIEEEASRIAGRDVRIGGKIELQLLPVPSFTIQRLRIADSATGSGEPLFRAERLDAKLSLAPLLRGVLEANEIELTRPSLHLVIDDAGRGNWRDLAQSGPAGTGGALPFLPTDVALQAVVITDGRVSLSDRNGLRERATVDHLAGLLSAPALRGPYRFNGRFGVDDQARDLRFTTLPPDSGGAIPFKVLLRDITTAASATLDGRLRDLDAHPTVTATLNAAFPRARPNSDAAKGAPVKPGPAAATPLADLKADVTGDSAHVELKNLSVAFDSVGRPEILSGGADFSWDGELTTVARLTTPWIDLDNVLGVPEGGNPLLALAAFGQRVNGLVPAAGSTSTRIEIDQANLGHAQVGNIRIDARSSSGLLALEQVRAVLPGGSRLDVQGSLTGQGAATTFDGDVSLTGASLARFAGWASSGSVTVSPKSDQPFELHSRVTVEPFRTGLRDIAARVGDSSMQGMIEYTGQEHKRLQIAIDGSRIDARSIAPARSSLETLVRLVTTPSQSVSPARGEAIKDRPADTAPTAPGTPFEGLSVGVTLDAAELVLPDQTLRDVSVKFESAARGLALERFDFSAAHGVAVALSGMFTETAGSVGLTSPLRGSIAAGDAEGLHMLAEMFDFAPSLLPPATEVAALLPLRLAGTVTQPVPPAPNAKSPLSIVADGQIGTADTKFRLELADGLKAWRTSQTDVDVVLQAPPGARLAATVIAMLRGERPVSAGMPPRDVREARVTRLALRATGNATTGLSTSIRFDSPDVTLYAHGTGSVDEAARQRLTADVVVETRDGRDFLADLGGPRLALAAPLVLRGEARINAGSGLLALDRFTVTTGAGTAIDGDLKLVADAARPEAKPQLTGHLSIASLDAATLLALVTRPPASSAEASIDAATAATGNASLWPSAAFDFRALADADVSIGVAAGSLSLADGVALGHADFKLRGQRDSFAVEDLTADGLGGKVAIAARLSRVPAGAAVEAQVAVTHAELAAFGGTGTADVKMTLRGAGNTPAGLVAALAGDGTTNLRDATVHALTAESLQAAVETALRATPELLSSELRAGLALERARPAVSLVPRQMPLAIEDGLIRFEPVTIVSAEGRSIGRLVVDLSKLLITGDWRVETRLPPAPATPDTPPPAAGEPPQAQIQPQPASPPLPAVVERFAVQKNGAVTRTSAETAELERELAVRKVERDLLALERLRKLDEARAREAQAAADQAAWTRQTEITGQAKPAQTPDARPQ